MSGQDMRPGGHRSAQDAGVGEQLDVGAQPCVAGREPGIGMRDAADRPRARQAAGSAPAGARSRLEFVTPADEAERLDVALAACGLDATRRRDRRDSCSPNNWPFQPSSSAS